MNKKIYFVMPAYNEEANIEEVVKQWYPIVKECGPDCRLIIANDGSKDKTWDKMQSLKTGRPQFITLDKPNSGHGATVLYLYRYALENGADYIFQTDSDGQTDPKEFGAFLTKISDYDMQIGTRYAREDGFSRKVVTKTLKALVWLMFGCVVKDANTPFRLISAKSLAKVMEVIPEDFFLSNVAISAVATKWNMKIGWSPITFRPRQGGVNSINMKRIFKIGVKAIGDFRIIRRNLKKAKLK